MKLAGSFANAGTRQLLDASSLSRGEIHRENLRFQMMIPEGIADPPLVEELWSPQIPSEASPKLVVCSSILRVGA